MDLTLFVIFLAATFTAGATGALFPTGDWYKSLEKPSWVPPNWIFPVAWTTIYLLMSFAGARVGGQDGSSLAHAAWALQIALNALWTPVFFGLRHWRASLITMAGLWLAVLACLITHWRIDWLAGLAFVPYMIWVCVAAALNLSVVRLNPGVKPLELHKM